MVCKILLNTVCTLSHDWESFDGCTVIPVELNDDRYPPEYQVVILDSNMEACNSLAWVGQSSLKPIEHHSIDVSEVLCDYLKRNHEDEY